MRFAPTEIAGVVRVESEPHRDDRGLFARLHCPEEFAAAGISFEPAQTSVSRNPRRHSCAACTSSPSRTPRPSW